MNRMTGQMHTITLSVRLIRTLRYYSWRTDAPVAWRRPCFKIPRLPKLFSNCFSSINDQLNDSIRAVESKTSSEELKTFKRGLGHVMYEVFEQIVEPICKQHPSLRLPCGVNQVDCFRVGVIRAEPLFSTTKSTKVFARLFPAPRRDIQMRSCGS